MIRYVGLWLFVAATCHAQVQGPFTASANFATNLNGPIDTRPECWGTAEVASWTLTFNPPPGYRVRILAIDGDLVSWIVTLPGDTVAVPAQSAAGVLLGLQTSDPVNSGRCDFCSDVARRLPISQDLAVQSTTILYIQDSVAQLMPKSRAAYTRSAVNSMLNADNKLIVTVASWLNTTGKMIHIEPTFVVTYQFEHVAIPQPSAPIVTKMRNVK
jgi:hypothetical protein